MQQIKFSSKSTHGRVSTTDNYTFDTYSDCLYEQLYKNDEYQIFIIKNVIDKNVKMWLDKYNCSIYGFYNSNAIINDLKKKYKNRIHLIHYSTSKFNIVFHDYKTKFNIKE